MTDGVVATSDGGGLGGLVVGIVVLVTIVLSVAFVWPLIVLLLELVAAGVLIGFRFLMGRWMVVAESAGERNVWPVRGRARAAVFAAEVADALRTGARLPVGASFESKASAALAEEDVAKRGPSGHVRVIRP